MTNAERIYLRRMKRVGRSHAYMVEMTGLSLRSVDGYFRELEKKREEKAQNKPQWGGLVTVTDPEAWLAHCNVWYGRIQETT